MTAKIAILISGRGSNMATIIEAQREGRIPAEIVLVLSNKDGAGGLALAKQAGIATAVVPSKGKSRAEFEKDVLAALEDASADFVCLAGFMRVLSEDFVVRWNGRMLNIHPSLLPLFRGLHVHEQALEAKVAVSGCTVHYVTPELDGGPIVGQAVVPVEAGDTPETLAARVQKAEHLLYPAALAKCLGGAPELPDTPGILLALR